MKAETRQRLLEAAVAVFVRRGFHDASVEEITREAGYTRGAFYSNFESKEAMFVELLQDRVYESYREMLGRVPRERSPLEQLRWAGRDLQERYEQEDRQWTWELWLECLAHAVRRPDFRSLAATFWSGNRAAMAAQMEELLATVEVPTQLDPKDFATAFIALDIGLKIQNLVDPDDVPLDLYPKIFEELFAPQLGQTEERKATDS